MNQRERYASDPEYRELVKRLHREYYAKNAEHVRQWRREYYLKNRDREIARFKRYYLAHRETCIAKALERQKKRPYTRPRTEGGTEQKSQVNQRSLERGVVDINAPNRESLKVERQRQQHGANAGGCRNAGFESLPTPLSDRDWWKLKVIDIPKRWRLEAV